MAGREGGLFVMHFYKINIFVRVINKISIFPPITLLVPIQKKILY